MKQKYLMLDRLQPSSGDYMPLSSFEKWNNSHYRYLLPHSLHHLTVWIQISNTLLLTFLLHLRISLFSMMHFTEVMNEFIEFIFWFNLVKKAQGRDLSLISCILGYSWFVEDVACLSVLLMNFTLCWPNSKINSSVEKEAFNYFFLQNLCDQIPSKLLKILYLDGISCPKYQEKHNNVQ